MGSAWPQAAGYLAVTLGVIVAAGSFQQPGDAPQAMQSAPFALGVGIALAVGGAGLLLSMAWGRDLFIVAMPLAAIALASNDPRTLWREDLPYTLLLIAPYALIVFYLSRPAAQRALARTNDGWFARGGLAMLVIVVAFGALYAWLASSGAARGGPRLFGFDHLHGGGGASSSAAFRFMRGLEQANAFVAKKAVAIVLFGHALTGLVAVSIPPRGAHGNAPARTSRTGILLLWLVACTTGTLCATLAEMVCWRALEGPSGKLVLVGISALGGVVFGAMQAAVPARESALRWILASAVGWTAGWLAASALIDAWDADYWEFSARTCLAFIALGVLLGGAQAIVLRGDRRTRWLWFATIAFAPLVGWAVYLPFVPDISFDNLVEFEIDEVLSKARHRGLISSAFQGAAIALLTAPLLWRREADFEQEMTTERKEGAVTGKQDVFRLIGFMTVYRLIQLAAPLFLMGLLIWAINQPHMELSDKGPLILVALGAWAIWELTRCIKWMGFQVVVTDERITVGKQTAAWTDITAARVKPAVKYDTWIELTPSSGEPLRIPAAIGQKSLLLTLVEKHHPDIQKG